MKKSLETIWLFLLKQTFLFEESYTSEQKQKFLTASPDEKENIVNNIIKNIVGILRFDKAKEELSYIENFGQIDAALIEYKLNKDFNTKLSFAHCSCCPKKIVEGIEIYI